MEGIKIKHLVINALLLILAVGNAVAAMFEWYDSAGMLVFNGICVALLMVAVMQKVFTMEPRKKWRVLSFLLSTLGVLSAFCAQFIEDGEYAWQKIMLYVVSVVLLTFGGISIVCWRRYSLERKAQLQNNRPKKHK